MKGMLVLFLTLLSFNSFAETSSIVCVDDFERQFPGKIQLEMDGRFAVKVLHAETADEFVEVEKFEPNPQNRFFRGGSEYFVTIQTSKKTYEGKLKLTTAGELQFAAEDEYFYFSCNN